MKLISRRNFVIGAAATTAACGNGIGSNGGVAIDSRVANTLTYMYNEFPGTQRLAENAAGILVMPLVTKAGLGVGGAFGRGALLIQDVTVDYYSNTQATIGFQIGAQQYAHVLFFMTDAALLQFRRSSGWAAGADLEYALSDRGANIGVETTTSSSPVVAVVFGQAGLLAGASLEGSKYSRIIP